MNLFLPSEDLAQRTLSHVQGIFRKLLYLVTLRDDRGQYRHWGMAHVFGDESARQAVQNAHHEILNEILRKSLRELWSELGDVSEPEKAEVQIQQLADSGRKLLPPGCSEATACHLSLVLLVLHELAQAPAETSNRPAA
jgi:hypothetical protein